MKLISVSITPEHIDFEVAGTQITYCLTIKAEGEVVGDEQRDDGGIWRNQTPAEVQTIVDKYRGGTAPVRTVKA